MGELGRDTLNLGEQVGIEHQLQDMFRMRSTLPLGVRNLIADRAKLRAALHSFQEV